MTTKSIDEILDELRKSSETEKRAGLRRLGIELHEAICVPMPVVRRYAKKLGQNHRRSRELWKTGVRECQQLAVLTAPWTKMTKAQANSWAKDWNSWDLVDLTCAELLWRVDFACELIKEWSAREEEFVRRGAFSLCAALAIHSHNDSKVDWKALLDIAEGSSQDERVYVKKAVSWAIREIGKRNRELQAASLALGNELAKMEDKTARWIGKDVQKDLNRVKLRLRHAED